jgi:3-dehydroquinate dehydratase / shikimate dehydrogenase
LSENVSTQRLCVVITASTTAELRAARDEVRDGDLIELRIDTVRDPDVPAALAGRRMPVIVTCRPTWEGGHFKGSEEERKRLLAQAIELRAEYVDVEWRAGFDDLIRARAGRGIIVSTHDFDGVPANLANRVPAMRATGAEVVKLGVMPRQLSDCLQLLTIGKHASGDLILIGMGDYGLATRILPGRFGSAWTYAGQILGIGQLSATTLLHDYRFRSLDDHTALYGLAAANVGHSVSPSMHNAAFAAIEQNAVYVPLPARTADDFVTFGRAIGLCGASVTIPHKVSLFDRVDEVMGVARRIGAINTIRVDDDGRWVGCNTDVNGFLQPLESRVALSGLRAAVLGAGGAARAVAIALASSGCDVRVHARNRMKAEAMAISTSTAVGPWPPESGSWDLLVNCTPVGMHPNTNETPLPAERLTGRYVYDLVYNPMATRLLRDAASVGCQTFGGLDMLVAQADEQFRWWTGAKPPAGVMREAAMTRLAEFDRHENYIV